MANVNQIPTATFKTAKEVIHVALLANQPVLLLGDPGVGKSALAYAVAAEMAMDLAILLGSTLDPTDVGGLPVVRVDGKGVDRLPLALIQKAADVPCVLFLDEISAAPLPVQAAMLRLMLERVAGDVVLHPETRILSACNPPEQAPGGFDLSAPLMGRVCALKFRPTEDEILDFLATLGTPKAGAAQTPMEEAIQEEAGMFAAVAKAAPEILQVDIPAACVTGNQPWGAPRAWERVIRARAAASLLTNPISSQSLFLAMAGSVGVTCATTYSGVLKMIEDLPTLEEIVADPEKARVPPEKNKQVAALAIMPKLAKANLWAAYIYASRLVPEFGMAAHKGLMAFAHLGNPADKLSAKGVKARVALTANIKRY
jgi:hypothetical protein